MPKNSRLLTYLAILTQLSKRFNDPSTFWFVIKPTPLISLATEDRTSSLSYMCIHKMWRVLATHKIKYRRFWLCKCDWGQRFLLKRFGNILGVIWNQILQKGLKRNTIKLLNYSNLFPDSTAPKTQYISIILLIFSKISQILWWWSLRGVCRLERTATNSSDRLNWILGSEIRGKPHLRISRI